MHRLNSIWGDNGYCIRLQQRKGSPSVISDLIFGIAGDETYSIEVKKVSAKKVRDRYGIKRAVRFSYGTGSAVTSKRKEEFPHQLERQVEYCKRMGWIPLLLLFVTHGPGIQTQVFLFDSTELLARQKAGIFSMTSPDFETFHMAETYDYLFRTGTPMKSNINAMRADVSS